MLLLLLGLLSCFPLTIEALPFVSTWITTQANETIWLPTINPQSALTIEWGDSTPSDIVPAGVAVDLNHTYDLPGPYNVSVNGQFRWLNAGTPTKEKLAQIVSWGDGFLIDKDSEGVFSNYPNLQISAPPDTQPVFLPGASLRYMFSGSTVGSPLHWDLKNVTDLSSMFKYSAFNHPLAFRNTQGVTTTAYMFYFALNFNQPFHFDASGLVDASRMFTIAEAFNQVVNLTNSRKLKAVPAMFASAPSFNQPVYMNTDSVTDMFRMFLYASKFNQPVNFNTSQVTDMSEMFYSATDFNQPLVMDTANVITTQSMFENATSFASTINFTSTAKVTNMRRMFFRASSFNQPLVMDTANVVTMESMFEGATSFASTINFTSTANVTNMRRMFFGASSFNQPLVMDTANVVTMESMFEGATSFASTINFTSTANVTNMRRIFKGVTWFDQDLSSWDTDQVASCEEFCPWCGLPNFTSCSPCFPRYTNEVNLTICSSGSRTPTTPAPTRSPTTAAPSNAPTTSSPSSSPTTSAPTTVSPSSSPTTSAPTTSAPTSSPSTAAPSSSAVSAAATADHGGLATAATIVAVAAAVAMWQAP